MNLRNHHKAITCFLFLFFCGFNYTNAQDAAPVPKPVMGIRYFLPANNLPYLEVKTQTKTGRVLDPLANIPVSVYFSEESPDNFLGKTITGRFGTGQVFLPASFKSTWDSLTEFTFVAVSDTAAGINEISSETTVKKAILVMDTSNADGVRTVTATLKEKKGNEWVAVADVEMKLRIKRLLGHLTVGEEETYTADSSGLASAEFKRDSMPGDEKGNLVLIAKVEDNETYGNIVVEKTVPWGKVFQADTHFWHRTLWSTGNRAPVWLLFLALMIIVGVWGTIFYLVKQVIKIIKMGKEYDRQLLTEIN